MHRLVVTVLAILLATASFAQDIPKTEEEKTLYAVGLSVSRSLTVFDLSAAELEIVKQGIADGASGKKPAVDLNAYTPKIQELAKARRKALGDKQAGASREFLERAAKEEGAVKTESGMVYLSLKDGDGRSPGAKDLVKVHYRGSLIDGREIDDSHKRGIPLELRMDGVIKCWTEGLQKMKAGGKARLACPSALAYGETGRGDFILPGAALAFEIELLEVKSLEVKSTEGKAK